MHRDRDDDDQTIYQLRPEPCQAYGHRSGLYGADDETSDEGPQYGPHSAENRSAAQEYGRQRPQKIPFTQINPEVVHFQAG